MEAALTAKETAMARNCVSWWSNFPPSPPLDTYGTERAKKTEGRMNDTVFLGACELAGIPATKRQARKWNNHKGLAIRFKREAHSLL
jgi:hypothetical protein